VFAWDIFIVTPVEFPFHPNVESVALIPFFNMSRTFARFSGHRLQKYCVTHAVGYPRAENRANLLDKYMISQVLNFLFFGTLSPYGFTSEDLISGN